MPEKGSEELPKPQEGGKKLPEPVANAVTAAYFSRAFNAPDTVRARAQVAFSTATVIATGLVAAGVFSNFVDAEDNFLYAGIVVLALWLFASGFSIYAATMSYKDPEQGGSAASGLEWARHVVKTSLDEREAVLRWQRAGTWTSLVALAATVALVGWWLASPSYATVHVQLVLTREGAGSYAGVCGVVAGVLDATVETKTLDADHLVVTPLKPPCNSVNPTIELPQTAIAAVGIR